MAAELTKTGTQGIFKRGNRYEFCYLVEGRQVWERRAGGYPGSRRVPEEGLEPPTRGL